MIVRVEPRHAKGSERQHEVSKQLLEHNMIKQIEDRPTHTLKD